jgi:hypothetical protein
MDNQDSIHHLVVPLYRSLRAYSTNLSVPCYSTKVQLPPSSVFCFASLLLCKPLSHSTSLKTHAGFHSTLYRAAD